MGVPQCRLSILRNGNVACRYFSNAPVDFRIVQCHLSVLGNGNVPCRYFLKFPVEFKMSNVACRFFKKRQCRSVEFKSQGPQERIKVRY